MADLPGAFSDMAQTVADASCLHTDITGPSILGALSTCCNRHHVVVDDLRDWTEPTSLYLLGIADSGEGKSTCLKHLFRPIKEWVKRKNADLRPEIAENEQRLRNLQNRLSQAEKDLKRGKATEEETIRLAQEIAAFERVKPVRLICDGDVTTEQLAVLLQDNGEHISVVSTEGGVFDTIAGRYNHNIVNSDLWLKAFNGESASIDRKMSASVTLDAPVVTAFIFCQPVVKNKLLGKTELRFNGFCERFLVFEPPSSVGQGRFDVPALSQPTLTAYTNEICRLLEIEETQYLRFSPAARAQFGEWYNAFEKAIPLSFPDLKGWARKHPGIIARVAGLLQLATDGSSTITEETMFAAINISDFFTEQAQIVFRGQGLGQDERDADYLWGKIKGMDPQRDEEGELFITYTDLQHRARNRERFSRREQYVGGLQVLIDKGYISIPAETNIEDVRVIYINPIAWGDKNE